MSAHFPNQSNRVKFNHLMRENSILVQTVKQLKDQLETARKINKQLLEKDPYSIDGRFRQVNQKNQELQASLQRLTASNSEYLCEILMNNQLICETHNQYGQAIANYEQKIADLRALLLKKEEYVDKLQKKYSKQKNATIGTISSANFEYFDQMEELRIYNNRLNIENSQLKYVNSKKQQQILHLKKMLLAYQQSSRKSQLSSTQQKRIKTLKETSSGDKKKSNLRINLETEIANFDRDMKELIPKKIHGTTINGLKLYLSHINNQNINLIKQRMSYESRAKAKDQEYRAIQRAYKKMQEQLQRQKEQIKMLKKELKALKQVEEKYVHTIGSYLEQQAQQNFEDISKQKQNFIQYWKKYQQDTDWKRMAPKCILSIQKETPRRPIKRSNSYSSIFKYLKQPQKTQRTTTEPMDQQDFSYFLQSCNPDLLVNQSIQRRRVQTTEQFIEQEISIIDKPLSKRFKDDYEADLKQIDLQQ